MSPDRPSSTASASKAVFSALHSHSAVTLKRGVGANAPARVQPASLCQRTNSKTLSRNRLLCDGFSAPALGGRRLSNNLFLHFACTQPARVLCT